MNANAISFHQCIGCKKHVLCMRVMTIINKQVSMCYGCITLAFDERIERQMQEEDLEMLIPDDEDEGYNRQTMAEENERQMEAEQSK
jgi:hypothetical protein